MSHEIIMERRSGVGWITINRPESRNAVSLEMWRQIHHAVEEFAEQPVFAVVITGVPGQFASGADIMEFGTTKATPEAARESFRAVDDTCRRLTQLPFPCIAAIDGFAIGAGLELAVACDFRMATATARLGITAAKMGITIGQGHIRRLVEVVGQARALDLLMTGRLVGADEAWRMGLLNEIVEGPSQLAERATELAEVFGRRAPLSQRWAKQQIRQSWYEAPLSPDDDATAAVQCFGSRDFQEAVAAFREKRAPHFTGE